MKITKTNDKRVGLNLKSEHKTKELRQKHEVCKTRIQKNIYCDEIKKHNKAMV
jgi:hypothetical protein